MFIGKMKLLFCDRAQQYARLNLVQCSSGNLSLRVGDKALISGTGSWLENLSPAQVAVCDIASGKPQDDVIPSMESVFHLGILRERSDVNVVLHFQSEYATTVACMKVKPKDFNVTLEVPYRVGGIAVIPYYRPGSGELAAAVTEAMKTCNAVLMSNHGQVVCGRDYDEVQERALFFEMACRIIVQSRMECTVLSPEDVQDLKRLSLSKISPEKE